LQFAPQAVAEVEDARADQLRVALHEDRREVGDQLGDARQVSGGDGLGVEEVAGVVELDVADPSVPLSPCTQGERG
jgi:hypothetical protein